MEAYQNIQLNVEKLLGWEKYREALQEGLKLVELEPDNALSYATIAMIYVKSCDYEKALSWSSQAIGLDPNYEYAWYARVLALYDNGNYDLCQEAIQEALKIDPAEHFYYFLLSSIYQRKGKRDKAKEQILIALEWRPNAAIYLSYLSYIEALERNMERSSQLEGMALEQEVESSLVFMQLAWAAKERKEPDLSETYIKEAIRLDPTNQQTQMEYLEALQENNKLYRLFLAPVMLIRDIKGWKIFLLMLIVTALFRPFIIIFVLLYALTHWGTKLFVHVKVFGWHFKR